MKKTVKECDVYLYNDSYVSEPPANTKVINKFWDDDLKCFVCVLKKDKFVVELVCSIILLLNIVLRIIIPALTVEVSIPDSVNFYDGKLFVTIHSDENNVTDVKCELLNNEYNLSPGETLYYVESNGLADIVDITVTSKFFIFNKTQDYTVSVNKVY